MALESLKARKCIQILILLVYQLYNFYLIQNDIFYQMNLYYNGKFLLKILYQAENWDSFQGITYI